MTTSTHLQIPVGVSSMTSKEQAMVVGGAIGPVTVAIGYFLLVMLSAAGGAVAGALTYAFTH